MNIREWIRQKRDGGRWADQEIKEFISLLVEEKIPDVQIGAILMAIYFQGMDDQETTSLTQAIAESGSRLSFYGKAFVCDKHSTGGIGDKTSFLIAPVVASAGCLVPMISGRALNFTGGTLDKLESIPRLRVSLSFDELQQQVQDIGLAIASQTREIAPADKLLYSMRDFTSTVESVPLIASSIMGKKLAEGLNGLVLDVKFGSGAFMKEKEQAKVLAQKMVAIGKLAGVQTKALLTRMDAPLGHMVGNANEIVEAYKLLDTTDLSTLSPSEQDLLHLSMELSAVLIGFAKGVDHETAKKIAEEKIKKQEAKAKFLKMVEAQEGDLDLFFQKWENAKKEYPILTIAAKDHGYLSYKKAENIGYALCHLRGGRFQKTDVIDPFVGMDFPYGEGNAIDKGDTIALVRYPKDLPPSALEEARNLIQSSLAIVEEPQSPPRLEEEIG